MNTKNLILSLNHGVRKIVINRPEKKNAINSEMYRRLAEILNDDAKNDKIVVTIITGSGEYYSSGNDIKSAMIEGSLDLPKKLVQAFIDYPKLLIAVVNGPAIGIAATTIALCDIIYASERAYFDTPFIRLGLCAEGASTHTFPNLLGRSKASEMIFLNKKLSAQEAYNFGLVSEVIPHEKLDSFIKKLYRFGSLPVNIVKINKELLMKDLKNTLSCCNEREIEALKICTVSEEFSQAVMMFLNKKSKL